MTAITIHLPDDACATFAGTPETFARELQLAAAIEWYREGRISQGRGAEIAGLNRWEFMLALSRAKVDPIQVLPDEWEEEARMDRQADRECVALDSIEQAGPSGSDPRR